MDPQEIVKYLGEFANSQIAQAGFFFTIAAWLHAGRVKKEIAKNFEALTTAINNMAANLRQDLDSHSKILDNLGGRVATIEQHISISKK